MKLQNVYATNRFQAWLIMWLAAIAMVPSLANASSYAEVEKKYYAGDYESCIADCQQEVEQRTWNARWPTLLIQCHLELGQYEAAKSVYETALERFTDDLRFRLIGRQVYRFNNKPMEGQRQLDQITELVQRMPWRYSGSEELVALGKLLVLQGEDARQVLELCYDRALKQNPANVEALTASTELALAKTDFAVAAQTIEKAIQAQPDNANLYYLKARSWEESDAEQAEAALRKSLELNARHVPAILMSAENLIDAEQFDEAESAIERALKINQRHPIAWALRSVIAHLRGDYDAEGNHRREALKSWNLNPEVDYTIGTKLSRHYRFDEAAAAHERALTMAPDYQPSMFALAQDLLRLGRTEEGWQILAAVRKADQYNVVAFNLTKLKEQLEKFATLEAPGLVVRMERRESEVYGKAVLELLSRARTTLATKYKAELREPVFVEIFDRQQDFAIRTFGLPGGIGYLGVCFGQLVTANSPASGGENPTNWQSVLWHEYCHVVTLQKSKNRMPRWLSEGISVYEERIENPTWGQPMDRHYRQMILSEDFTPISELSSAFLSPKSGMHLQFAYFESSLAVQFLVEQYGFEQLLRILDDLGSGLPINGALERVTGNLKILDEQFKSYAEAKAKSYGTNGDWSPLQNTVEQSPGEGGALALNLDIEKFLHDHPTSPLALRMAAEISIDQKDFLKAKEHLEKLRSIEPEDPDPDGLYAMLARTYQALGEQTDALKSLRKLVEISPNPLMALTTLVAIEMEAENWAEVDSLAKKYLAVQPMRTTPHEWIIRSAKQQDKLELAQDSLNAMLQLNPLDPAQLHYTLGLALKNSNPALAKRHVLQALELAPRYLEALTLLEQLPNEQNADSFGSP